jgi:ubiquinone/menaquinone biosynthesis C-methylase UbiE
VSHFAHQADFYARYRPDYPQELFAFVASIAPGKKHAWDCATGNGQAALGLAEHFAKVIATDISSEQISRARPHPGIEYRVAAAEASGLPHNSVDAITVCQGLHWLDRPRFFVEAKRVLASRGVLVATVYADAALGDSTLDPILQHFNKTVVGKFWPPERKLVDEQYRSIKFPFEELATPKLVLAREWNLEQLVGYVRSWSATVRYLRHHGTDPTADFQKSLQQKWGSPQGTRRIAWPFTIRACRVPLV